MKKSVIIVVALLVAVFGISYFASRDKGAQQPNTAPTETPTASGKTLDLSGQQLTAIPESVLAQTDITDLNLSNNQLTSLPSDIAKLTNLEILNIENNRIESLPAEISQLKMLRDILANNNRLKNLPLELGAMTWLQNLDVSGSGVPDDDVQQLKAMLPNTAVKG